MPPYRSTKEFKKVEYTLYEVSAEVVLSLLEKEDFQREIVSSFDSFEELIYKSLAHTQSEGARVKSSLEIMQNLWSRLVEIPFITPGLLSEFEHERLFFPHYRDHTIHQLQVFLLGCYFFHYNKYLYDSLLPILNELKESQHSVNCSIARIFYRVWLITALYHDQGYLFERTCLPPDEKEKSIQKRIFEKFNTFFKSPLAYFLKSYFSMNFEPQNEIRAQRALGIPSSFFVESFDDFLLDETSSSPNILDLIEDAACKAILGNNGKPFNSYLEMCQRARTSGQTRPPFIDHGIASAVMLLRTQLEITNYAKLLDSCKSSPNFQKNFFGDIEDGRVLWLDLICDLDPIVKEAASAMALHNVQPEIWDPNDFCSPRYKLTLERFKIGLKNQPIAFLLRLCDTLQDWDRPKFYLSDREGDISRIDQHFRISADVNGIGIDFLFVDSDNFQQKKDVQSKLIRELKSALNDDDVDKIIHYSPAYNALKYLTQNALSFTKSSSQSISLSDLENHWGQYREATSGIPKSLKDELELESKKRQHFSLFSNWCHDVGIEIFSQSVDTQIEDLLRIIRQEGRNLNELKIGSLIQDDRDGTLWEVLESLGRGGFGNVWKVKNQTNKSLAAFKQFHTGQMDQYELLGRFRRGFESMSTLHHSQITRVWGFQRTPRGYFLDYVDGTDLAKGFLKNSSERKSFSKNLRTCFETPILRLGLIKEVCDIVSFAHDNSNGKIYHRDIKPENILMRETTVQPYFTPVLTDFDMVWHPQATPLTQYGANIAVSHFYASPELKKVSPDQKLIHSPTVDVFSLGRMIYFIFTDSHPDVDVDLGDKLKEAIEKRHLSFINDSLKSFPALIVQIFRKASHINYRHRYNTVKELSNDISYIIEILKNPADLAPSIFFYELNYRINTSHARITLSINDLEKIVNGSFPKRANINLPSGDIVFEYKDVPQSGKSYIQVVIRFSQDHLALSNSKGYNRARNVLNDKIDKALRECNLRTYQTQQHGGDAYVYSFRIAHQDLSINTLVAIEHLSAKLSNTGQS